jgi:hypothetical protein
MRNVTIMATAIRTTKSFSLEKELVKELERTKGGVSTSERVNRLLKIGLEIERRRSLYSEAAAFFAGDTTDASSRKPFREASMKVIRRD